MTLLYRMAEKTEDKLDKLKRTQSDKNDSEYVKTVSKLNESLRLCNERIRSCDELLCRPFRIFGKSNFKSNFRDIKTTGIRPLNSTIANILLNISRRCCTKPILRLLHIFTMRRFLWCHKSSDVAKQPNSIIHPNSTALNWTFAE